MWTWYVARATGLVSLLLLTGTLVLGISGVTRFATPGWPRFVLARVHRATSLLVVAFLAVHIVTVVLDGYVSVTWLDVILPFASAYSPFWLGLGVVAFDLLLALIVTSLLRARIGLRTWRAVHWAAYACWPIAVVHGLGIGTDSTTPWALGLTIGCIAVAAAGTVWRIRAAPQVTTAGQPVVAPARADAVAQR